MFYRVSELALLPDESQEKLLHKAARELRVSPSSVEKIQIYRKSLDARKGQVLCVTHSAQIASLAHNHLYISKTEQDGRVSTTLTPLDRAGRVGEIARILGGIEITDAVRHAAEEMIAEGETY